MLDLFVPISVFITFTVIVGLITRLIATISLNRTIREALRNDPASVPVLAARLGSQPPWGDALLGWLFLSLAAGMALFGLTEDAEQRSETLRAAIVPIVVGVTVLIYTRYAARSGARS